MKDLHETHGVIDIDAPCKTYNRSLRHDDRCVYCGKDFMIHKKYWKSQLLVMKGPIVKRKIRPIKVSAVLGRNEMCSCGSGKKFKKCCKK